MMAQDRLEFFEALSRVAVIFNKAKDLESLEPAYWQALSDFDIELVKDALVRAERQCKYWPKPSELRAFMDEAKKKAAILRPLAGTLCEVCGGDRWQIRYCGGNAHDVTGNTMNDPVEPCGRPVDGRLRAHTGHSFAVPCVCHPERMAYEARRDTRKGGNRWDSA